MPRPVRSLVLSALLVAAAVPALSPAGADPSQPRFTTTPDLGSTPGLTPRTQENRDGSCTAYVDGNEDGDADDGERVATIPFGTIPLRLPAEAPSAPDEDRDGVPAHATYRTYAFDADACTLTLDGSATDRRTVLSDGFEDGLAPEWARVTGDRTDVCGTASGAKALAMYGAPRIAETRPIDVRHGGEIAFDLGTGTGGCDLADRPQEQVRLEYSADGGDTWHLVRGFANEGGWTRYEVDVPAPARTPSTRFRLVQLTFDGFRDVWVLDDVQIQRLEPDTGPEPVGSGTIRLDPDDGDCNRPVPHADEECDGVPDPVEAQICGREATRVLVEEAGVGRCDSTTEYVPPDRAVLATLPVDVDLGPDADDDGVPEIATVRRVNLTVHVEPVRVAVEPAPSRIVPLDSRPVGDDDDPERPAPSTVRTPVPAAIWVEVGPDGDDDRIPRDLVLHRGHLTLDRRLGHPTIGFETVESTPLTVDGCDADAGCPAPNPLGPVSVPVEAAHGPDHDDDGLPGHVDVTWLDVTVDRTRTVPVVTGSQTTRETVDPDDGNRSDPVPFDMVDGDADDVPDAAEPWICFVEDRNGDYDGRCEGDDYIPPARVPNPWNV